MYGIVKVPSCVIGRAEFRSNYAQLLSCLIPTLPGEGLVKFPCFLTVGSGCRFRVRVKVYCKVTRLSPEAFYTPLMEFKGNQYLFFFNAFQDLASARAKALLLSKSASSWPFHCATTSLHTEQYWIL